MSLPVEVFLSHATEDRTVAAELADMLRRHHVPVWFSRTDIRGAQQWHDEIGEALNRCDWFMIILTPKSVQSMWVKRELVYALQEKRYENRIVPLLYEACAVDHLSWVLRQLQTIDLQQRVEEGYHELLNVWGLGYRRA